MDIFKQIKLYVRQKSILVAIIVSAIIIFVIILNNNKENTNTETTLSEATIVNVTTPAEYSGGQSLSFIGDVRSFTEADITSERSGRVVSVNVSLGQNVTTGTILATLENASERASLLQAEGVYDAAVASAAQSNIGVEEAENGLQNAKNNAVSAFKSSYNTTNGIVVNSIDAFFGNPNKSVPGLRIDGRGFTTDLNNERVTFQSILPTWQARVNTISSESNLETELEYASQNIQRTINVVDIFLIIFNQQENYSRYSETELQSFSNTFTGLRSTLISLQSSIDSAKTGLIASTEALERAKLSAAGGTTSIADAQVKQALGSLRAAQANLSETILRTPINGTVNSISVRQGDFINSFTKVGVVANNNALEVVSYVSDTEAKLLNEGDTVMIEGVIEGVVTEIAPAVDNTTKKTEIRIAAEGEGIINGDTVRVTKEFATENIKQQSVQVPLTSIKFDRENGSLFIVENDILVARPVKLGRILGNSVTVTSGISSTDSFVIDVRGLIAGEKVKIQN